MYEYEIRHGFNLNFCSSMEGLNCKMQSRIVDLIVINSRLKHFKQQIYVDSNSRSILLPVEHGFSN